MPRGETIVNLNILDTGSRPDTHMFLIIQKNN